MSFTDDNLKRLKEWGCIPGNQWTLEMDEKFHAICAEKMQALLARLEASEACLDLPHMRHTEPECTFCSRYIAWRKAAGK